MSVKRPHKKFCMHQTGGEEGGKGDMAGKRDERRCREGVRGSGVRRRGAVW